MSDIQAALDTLLNTWATANAIPVVWENYNPNDDSPAMAGPFVKAFILPAETGSTTLGPSGYQTAQGVYQVTVAVKKGNGTAVVRPLVASLQTVFARGVVSDGVRVLKSWPAPALTVGAWYMVPVSVRYRVLI